MIQVPIFYSKGCVEFSKFKIFIHLVLLDLEALEPCIYVLVVNPLPLLHCAILLVLFPLHSPLSNFNSLSKLLKSFDSHVLLIL